MRALEWAYNTGVWWAQPPRWKRVFRTLVRAKSVESYDAENPVLLMHLHCPRLAGGVATTGTPSTWVFRGPSA